MSVAKVELFQPAPQGGLEKLRSTASPVGPRADGACPPAREGGGVCPPSFIQVTPPRCSRCSSPEFRTLINPILNPPNVTGLLCPACFVAACPHWWTRYSGTDIHALIERDYCRLSKAAVRHVSLLTFFVPALKGVPNLAEHAEQRFYARKEHWICLYAYEQEWRARDDYFLKHAVIERNVFNWMRTGKQKAS